MNLGPYSKAANSGLVALVSTFLLLYADKELDLKDWISLVIVVAAQVGFVFQVRNDRFKIAKAVVGAVVTFLGSGLASLQDGQPLGVTLILTAVLAVLNGYVAIYSSPNAVASNADSTSRFPLNQPQHSTEV
jgi:hypothetical protein